MNARVCATLCAFLLCLAAGLPAQNRFLPIEEVKPGMTGIGRTVFDVHDGHSELQQGRQMRGCFECLIGCHLSACRCQYRFPGKR